MQQSGLHDGDVPVIMAALLWGPISLTFTLGCIERSSDSREMQHCQHGVYFSLSLSLPPSLVSVSLIANWPSTYKDTKVEEEKRLNECHSFVQVNMIEVSS